MNRFHWGMLCGGASAAGGIALGVGEIGWTVACVLAALFIAHVGGGRE